MAKRRKPDEPDPEIDEDVDDLPEWDDQQDSDELEDEEQWPDPAIEAGPGPFNPVGNRKVWITLVVICAIIAVAVLYVYQAGDDKTILGNQPIPAALPEGGAAAAEGAPPTVRGQAFALPGGGAGGSLTVKCPYCGNDGLPMCSKCNAVMQPLGGNSGLYACSSCGTAGVPICPRCGTRMNPW